jgi:hypothetical protein
MLTVSPFAYADEATFRVPFAFTVGEKTLPPDTYRVSMVQSVLMIQGSRQGACVLTNRLESLQPTGRKLVFHRHDGEYFLTQWWLSATSGRQIEVPSKAREGIETALYVPVLPAVPRH